jgi:cytochrome P450
MADRARRVSDAWRDGGTIDAAAEMAAVTMTVAAKTLFDADLDAEVAEIRDALTTAIDSFTLALLPYGDHLARLPIPAAIRFRRARAHLDAIIYRLIADRRARPHERGDLISLLVSVRDAEGDGGGLSDEEIRDDVLTLLLAGYETTANALMWTWYLLSEHPDAERRLHEELDAALAGRTAGARDLPALRYTRAVIAESMRLFSPAYLVGRRALVPYDVPGTDYVLPEGTYLFLCQHLLHRDPRFWREPERFQPERWLEGEPHSHKFAYFPFGAGARVCIGEPFAWMEATLVLATIARRWRLRLVPGHPVVRQPIITLRSKFGMRMTCACRMP